MWCGQPFEVKSPNQKYCSSDIKECSKEAKRENWRKASSKYRKRYKEHVSVKQVYKLGSGFLSLHPHHDFDEEYHAIQKEKKRLRLKGVVGVFPIGINCSLDFVLNFLRKIPNISVETVKINPIAVIVLLIIIFLILMVYIFIINERPNLFGY